MSSFTQHSVGKRVRVVSRDKEASHRAVVSYSYVDEMSQPLQLAVPQSVPHVLYDVLYDQHRPEEETAISGDRLLDLLPFELTTSAGEEDVITAAVWKDRGNALFGLKDYYCAINCYNKALAVLNCAKSLSIGSEVVLLRSDGDYHQGLVSNFENGEIEVVLDDDEDVIVQKGQDMFHLSSSKADRLVERAVYLNLARCAIKKGMRGWAVRYASTALAIAKSISLADEKLVVDCLFFRGKALVMACRPGKAMKDGHELAKYDISKSQQLIKEAKVFKETQLKENKKLAREIAKWVDQAVSSAPKRIDRSDGDDDLDIEVLSDEDVECDQAKSKPTKSMFSSSFFNVVSFVVVLMAVILVIIKKMTF